MPNFLEELLASSPAGAREIHRGKLRVAVAEGILQFMKANAISKAELARKAGVSRAQITQALSSSRNMTLNTLSDISSALDLEPRVDLLPKTVRAAPIKLSTSSNASSQTSFVIPPGGKSVECFSTTISKPPGPQQYVESGSTGGQNATYH